MGLYFLRTDRATTGGEPSASITWREYSSAFAAATGEATGGTDAPAAPRGPCPGSGLELDETAIGVLSERVRRRPGDDTAHRQLGLTHLARGRTAPAVRHLEIAFRLVRRRAQRAVGLTDALQLQCEAARLRLTLMRLYMRLGQVDKARSLAQEAQAVL